MSHGGDELRRAALQASGVLKGLAVWTGGMLLYLLSREFDRPEGSASTTRILGVVLMLVGTPLYCMMAGRALKKAVDGSSGEAQG